MGLIISMNKTLYLSQCHQFFIHGSLISLATLKGLSDKETVTAGGEEIGCNTACATENCPYIDSYCIDHLILAVQLDSCELRAVFVISVNLIT